MLFLPEATHSIGAAAGSPSAAERLDGPSMSKYAAMAREHNIWLSLGFPERADDADSRLKGTASADGTGPADGESTAMAASRPKQRGFNSHVIISNLGEIVCSYRKVCGCSCQLTRGALRGLNWQAAAQLRTHASPLAGGRSATHTCPTPLQQ